MNKRSGVQSLVSWPDNKELSLKVDAIGWNSLKEKTIVITNIIIIPNKNIF